MTTRETRADGAPTGWKFPGKYVSVTTYRRDGTGVATPVWFAQESERLLFRTGIDSGKAKRIRRNPAVLVAACTARGELLGQQVSGVARVLAGSAADDAKRLVNRKYRAGWAIAGTWCLFSPRCTFRTARRYSWRSRPAKTPPARAVPHG